MTVHLAQKVRDGPLYGVRRSRRTPPSIFSGAQFNRTVLRSIQVLDSTKPEGSRLFVALSAFEMLLHVAVKAAGVRESV